MITYEETLAELSAMKDEKYRIFNERIVNVPAGTSIGVRTPLLRDYAKKFVKRKDFSFAELFSWPNGLYEIRLLKCLCVGYAKVPFAEKEALIEKCLPVIDGWGVCDLFCATLKEIEKHRKEFLPNIERYIAMGAEFSQRFGYILLLGCYMEEGYLPGRFPPARRGENGVLLYIHGRGLAVGGGARQILRCGGALLKGGCFGWPDEEQGDSKGAREFPTDGRAKKLSKIFEKLMKK